MCIEISQAMDVATIGSVNKNRMAKTLQSVLLETESESNVSVKFGTNCVYILITHNSSLHFETVQVRKDEDEETTSMQEMLIEALYVENGIVIIKIDAYKKLSVYAKTNKSEFLNFVMEQQLWPNNNKEDELSTRKQQVHERNYEETFNNSFFPPSIRYPKQ